MPPPRIAIIGDFRSDYLYHEATGRALELSARGLGVEMHYAWMPTATIEKHGVKSLTDFGGFWVAPGSPYESLQGALAGIRFARETGKPLVGT